MYLEVGDNAINSDAENWAIAVESDTSRNLPYDFGSIMHYSLNADVRLKPPLGTTLWESQGSPPIGVGGQLSIGDVLTLNTMYDNSTTFGSATPFRHTDLDITVGGTVTGDIRTGVHFFPAEGSSPEAIHRFIVPEAGGQFQFSTCGSSVATVLRVYDRHWQQVEMADNDGPCSPQTVLTTTRLEGGPHWLLVEGNDDFAESGASGAYTLTMAAGAVGTTPVFQPSVIQLSPFPRSSCAPEGGFCDCTGIMRFGRDAFFSAKRTTGVTECSRAEFGVPFFGTMDCECNPDIVRNGVTTGAGVFKDQGRRLEAELADWPEHAHLLIVPCCLSNIATYEFSTCGSDFNTVLRVVRAAQTDLGLDTSGEEIAWATGGCPGDPNKAALQVRLEEGTYWVVVGGMRFFSGAYELKSGFAPNTVESIQGICSVRQGYSNQPERCPEGYTDTQRVGACGSHPYDYPVCVRVIDTPIDIIPT